MSKYDIEYRKLTLQLLPMALRRARISALIYRLIAPVVDIYTRFLLFRTEKLYRLNHNGQVFSLEQVICDFCNNSECYITDGELDAEVLVPFDSKGEMANYQQTIPYDQSVDPQLYIRYEGWGFDTYADFIVHLPSAIYGQINETALCALIDNYKVAGKFYRIVYDGIVIANYSFTWSGENCVLVESVPHTFAWSGENCVLIENIPYSFAWSGDNCVKIEKKTEK